MRFLPINSNSKRFPFSRPAENNAMCYVFHLTNRGLHIRAHILFKLPQSMQTESKSWKGSFLAEPNSLFQKVNMKGKMDLFPFSLGGHIYLLRMLCHNIRELPLC